MAKNSVRDFDATAANNTDIQSVDIAENCAPSGINNAIRELMADIKDVSAGTVALESPQADSLTVTGDLTVDTNTLFVDASADAVGVNATTLDASLQIGALNTTGTDRGAVSIKTEASGATIGESAIYIEEQSGAEGYYVGVNSDGAMFFSNSGASTPTLLLGDDDNVGIGTTSPAGLLHLSVASGVGSPDLILERTDTSVASGNQIGSLQFFAGEDGSEEKVAAVRAVAEENFSSSSSETNLRFETTVSGATSASERMRITGDGSVLVAQTSGSSADVGHIFTPTGAAFHVRDGGIPLILDRHTSDGEIVRFRKDGATYGNISAVSSGLSFGTGSSGTERMRIDSSGIVLVSTTSDFASGTVDGIVAQGTAKPAAAFSNTTDGQIVKFYQGGSLVGSIATFGGDIQIGTGDNNLYFNDGATSIEPRNADGTRRDNALDMGHSSARFDDIYATNGTIQTSDQNEKQQIASLTDAEITAAKAISKLFKTFKWNDSVLENGDNARTHAGVIAQDISSAMTDANLDATKYAFFCSDTWWETQTEVPAVEAVEAVEAVYEDVVIEAVLDDEGNEVEPERTEQRLVSEAVEAVKARDAYTRTDTYDTADEAPEGATERTRLGIRYPELLAFIGAATEQRLTSIEARLTALEA